ncbi:hypothetical protein BDN71DRAFT_1054889 [Pleurotus eryngii]|uniref:Uncharacterized protein n=1 Tax=Pleurotus eryngii TaxID=5323 RepID=A0A9P6DEZ9_PLEER|nr:hypothetical protein BDN71DRAFT_1054889 [Pleurotus eryngii]
MGKTWPADPPTYLVYYIVCQVVASHGSYSSTRDVLLKAVPYFTKAQPTPTTAPLAVLLLATQIPWTESTLNALRVAHAHKPLKPPDAVSARRFLAVVVVVGGADGRCWEVGNKNVGIRGGEGTAGIGAAPAAKAARYSVNPGIHIVGRNGASVEKVIAEFRAANPNGTCDFHEYACISL